MKRRYITIIIALVVMLLLASCGEQSQPAASGDGAQASKHTSSSEAKVSAGSITVVPQGKVYTDAKLGFQITTPDNWQALAQPGSQAAIGNSAVTFTVDEQSTHSVIVVGVFHGASMPSAFAARGLPTAHIGPYPAFIADRSNSEGRAPCLVRIFLAGNDYVMADWCETNALARRAQLEQVLATYQPAPASFTPRAITAPAPQTCTGMQDQLGYSHVSWGGQLATPTAGEWHQVNMGLFICSNEGSNDWYLFQCTELINRYIYEHFALPHLPGNAARYLDYYLNGVMHPGIIHTFPAGSYQVSDDASQGKSAFKPVAGDVLVFQDVNNPSTGWTSGLINSPGHVALVVGVDDTHVYIAQENYNQTQYFLALPMRLDANGYAITDLSGWSQRIVRGWIHFTANGGARPTALS